MISQLVTVKVAIVLLWTFNVMNVEAYKFSAPIKFDDRGHWHIILGNVTFSLNADFQLTISDGDCETTLSLKPPTEIEILSKRGVRNGTSVCTRCGWNHANVTGGRKQRKLIPDSPNLIDLPGIHDKY
ncbi:unnamed protein product [Schistosoma rodhaini]|uniref:Uncharacterized protein n=1 Tax=Schistosoma rodhaini TaxID=6188 RepID=A0AA85FNR2_9TREM|nr:unnamed protein product [Schistosoma rodhaini]